MRYGKTQAIVGNVLAFVRPATAVRPNAIATRRMATAIFARDQKIASGLAQIVAYAHTFIATATKRMKMRMRMTNERD